MSAQLELLGGRSCRRCIRRHVGPAVETIASVGSYDTCGGCGKLVVVYAFTYWYPWPEVTATTWHPSRGRRADWCVDPLPDELRQRLAAAQCPDHFVGTETLRCLTCGSPASSLCEDCGEEGGNHSADCPVFDEPAERMEEEC